MDSANVLHELQTILGVNQLYTDEDTLQRYGTDRTTQYKPHPLAVVFPKHTDEVQQVVQLANKLDFKIVPSGGRTGLSGGAVAAQHEVVLSLEKMNRIIEFNAIDRAVCCEAGVITKQLQDFTAQQNLFYPVDLASSGSCTIGGNIATNAGGNRVLRFGMTRQWLRGLTVVTGRGEKLVLNRGLKKNNTGYDLVQLMAGSEGTLGIICDATLELTRPPHFQTVLFGLNSIDEVMQVFAACHSTLELSSVEFFTNTALQYVCRRHGWAAPLTRPAAVYVLVEYIAAEPQAECMHKNLPGNLLHNSRMAHNSVEAVTLWRYRESISEAIADRAPLKQDVAVRPSRIVALVQQLERLFGSSQDWELVLFGHFGDGNLHVNLLPRRTLEARVNTEAEQAIWQLVSDQGGTLSAEHGLGLIKTAVLNYDPVAKQLMKQLKHVLDPRGILNPDKLMT